MKRLLLVAALVLLGSCSGEKQQETEAEGDNAPIGPGSDSSALISPDTPQSRTGEASRQVPAPGDSTPR